MNVTDQYHIGNIHNFYYDNGNQRVVCDTCGAVEERIQANKEVPPSAFSFIISVFVDNHNRCNEPKRLKVGDPVTDLAGSYLGKIAEISRVTTTALVKDAYKYKKTHSLSELLLSK